MRRWSSRGELQGTLGAKKRDAHLSTRAHSLLRLRQELDKLLAYQASKIPDAGKQRAFLQTHYEELLAGLSVSWPSFSRRLPYICRALSYCLSSTLLLISRRLGLL